jgi:hypothetical protein
MNAWTASLVARFPPGVSQLWIAIDPDDVLLDEQFIADLNNAGFDLLDFDDPIIFRAEYEERYRSQWESGGVTGRALVLRYRSTDPNELPWDYLSQARIVRLGLAELFPNLTYAVVKAIEPRHLAQLHDAHRKHAPQPLGETATKDFILTHIFKISAVLITRHEDLWREVLRCHYNDLQPPLLLTQRVVEILSSQPQFAGIDIEALLVSKATAVDALQRAWRVHVSHLGVEIIDVAQQAAEAPAVPFSHPDVRTFVDTLFLDGELQPIRVALAPASLPSWVQLGITVPAEPLTKIVEQSLLRLAADVPGTAANHRDWGNVASRFGELQRRYHLLPYNHAVTVTLQVDALREQLDNALFTWLQANYAALPSLAIGAGPVVLSHIARYLAIKRTTGGSSIAILVFDGMSFDQWKLIKDHLSRAAKALTYDETAVFAWLPTLTSVCRQSIFSGLRPREFADTIDTTVAEEAHWIRFWLDHQLRKPAIGYVKGLKRVEQLASLDHLVPDGPVKAQAIVVDAIDEMVHGATLGKRGMASQIQQWLETGFVELLLTKLLGAGFQVFITSDHGNTDALGAGRPRHGDVPEVKGERTRVYRSELLRSQAGSEASTSNSLPLGSLPQDYLPIFAKSGRAFTSAGDRIVAHGGASLEEVLIPFVKVSHK